MRTIRKFAKEARPIRRFAYHTHFCKLPSTCSTRDCSALIWWPAKWNVSRRDRETRTQFLDQVISVSMSDYHAHDPWFLRSCTNWFSFILLSYYTVTVAMEAFSALMVVCAGNSPVTGEFLSQRPVTRNFDIWCLMICDWTNGWVNNRETGDLRRHHPHYDVTVMS